MTVFLNSMVVNGIKVMTSDTLHSLCYNDLLSKIVIFITWNVDDNSILYYKKSIWRTSKSTPKRPNFPVVIDSTRKNYLKKLGFIEDFFNLQPAETHNER